MDDNYSSNFFSIHRIVKLLEVGFILESILTGKGMLASFNNGLKQRGGL